MSITHMWQLREKWQGSESSPVSSTETCRTLRLSLRVLCCRSVSCLDKDNMCFPCLKTPLQDLMVPCKHEIQTLLIISSKSQQIRFSLWMLTSIISAKNKFYCSGIPKTATQNLQSQNKGLEHENSIPFFFSIKWLNLDIRSLCLKKKNVIVCPEELVYTEPLFALFLITRCLHQLPHQLPGSFRSTSGLMRRWVMWWRSGKYLNSCAVKKTHTVIRMCSADQPASSLVVVSRMNTEKPTQQRLG